MKWKFLYILFGLFLSNTIRSQSIDALVEEYNAKTPHEKIYIQFDNSLYLPGQTVWYKAYFLKGSELSELSKTLYVNWFDDNGNLLDRTISPINPYTASGSFNIPSNYSGTHLQILAYTQWMLNFDSAFLFRRSLPVEQARRKPSVTAPMNLKPTIQFFPEGGEFVENISSNVAFKIMSPSGLPMDGTGFIVNNDNQEIAQFSSKHDGMGRFLFTPKTGEKYTCQWKDSRGKMYSSVLPAAKKSGIVLTVHNDSGIPSFTIERTESTDDRFRKLTFVATINQKVVLYANVDLSKRTKAASDIAIGRFPSGILQLTVFDSEGQPAAERVLFINREEFNLPVMFQADTVNLNKRGKNIYFIDIEDTIQASLSISITAGEGFYDSTQHIISQFLLSSEIKGRVHNPAYYFSGADSAQFYLDFVMLTNGWRKFKWNDVLNHKAPLLNYQRDSSYISIIGSIDKTNKIKKGSFISLLLLAKDSTRQAFLAPIQPDGSFRKDNLILFDTTKIFYQIDQNLVHRNGRINIVSSFIPFNNTLKIPVFEPETSDTASTAYDRYIAKEQQRIDELRKSSTLEEVIVTGKIKTRLQEIDDRYTTGSFKDDGIPVNVVDDPVATSFPNFLNYLQNRAPVAGLTINPSNRTAPVTWRSGTGLGASATAFFIDEIQLSTQVDISTISMADIAYIKVFRPPFSMAKGGGAGGAIALYTKKGGDGKSASRGLNFTAIAGYSTEREYYSPTYAEQFNVFTVPDLRRTLYWQPNININGDHKKVRISFYNNDLSRSIRIVLEGVTADGRIIHFNKLIKEASTN